MWPTSTDPFTCNLYIPLPSDCWLVYRLEQAWTLCDMGAKRVTEQLSLDFSPNWFLVVTLVYSTSDYATGKNMGLGDSAIDRWFTPQMTEYIRRNVWNYRFSPLCVTHRVLFNFERNTFSSLCAPVSSSEAFSPFPTHRISYTDCFGDYRCDIKCLIT